MAKGSRSARASAAVHPDAPHPDQVARNHGGGFFEGARSIEELAREQGVEPVTDFESLAGDFWPEDESADEFIAAVRAWRAEGRDRGTS